MRALKLSQEKYAIVDNSDFDYLNQWKWSYHSGGYAFRNDYKNKKAILLHRAIMSPSSGMDIDHINHNKLDNRRNNLRICTTSQNMANNNQKRGISGLRGVYWCKLNKKWKANGSFKHKIFHLGLFDNKIEAARKRDEFAKKYYGKFARLNNV